MLTGVTYTATMKGGTAINISLNDHQGLNYYHLVRKVHLLFLSFELNLDLSSISLVASAMLPECQEDLVGISSGVFNLYSYSTVSELHYHSTYL